MKTFAYYVTNKPRDAAGNPKDTVTVIYIARNVPLVIGSAERGYRNAEQAAADIAIGAGKLGKAQRGKSPARLFNDGVAHFYQV